MAAQPATLAHGDLLDLEQAFGERLGARRATGDIDIDGDDLVDALDHRVAQLEQTAAVGARAHRQHILGIGHLVVEQPAALGHLVGECAGDEHEIRVAR